METRYKDSKIKDSVEAGNVFQDYITDLMFEKYGVVIQNYTSRKYQYDKGENRQGAEIKYDSWCSSTKRLSIEISEKTALEQSWCKSGIYRDDNSIFYIQGNFDIVFLFSKKLLQMLHKTGKYQNKEEQTIKTFYLPFLDAERYSIVQFKK